MKADQLTELAVRMICAELSSGSRTALLGLDHAILHRVAQGAVALADEVLRAARFRASLEANPLSDHEPGQPLE